MSRRIWSYVNIAILALVVLGVNRLEASPQTERQVKLSYNGLTWVSETKSADVAELLLEQLGEYDQLSVNPEPSTQITEGMLVDITDKKIESLAPTVASNLKTRQVQLATKPTPPKVTKPVGPINSGLATWYRFGDKLTAASRKYPKGTRLKVVAVNSGKSVEVTVNDYGPSALTGIDLDLNVPAFEAIAPLGAGKIKVKYYKL